ncbi:MerR family transcriptional regulator [Caldimonas brevitalea]|uniref:MerR family transcriptional regulator n=1 Tax=Caldimonas brevitalea TaxID=413882 RepID=A0A0G3BPT6_9BURK|nr:MerR family transcriptional regulator [Caldimonas brevitalea]AKJ28580.1 MerR family transcriptional regulator [Caldimonas brevitalea]
MSKTLYIGTLAAEIGRSVHTIRWYEAQGLVPGVMRDGGGRRLYTEQHVGWLRLMDRLRRTGMPIREMRRYTALVQQGRSTLDERRALLCAHRERVQQTLAEWSAALGLLDAKIDFYERWLDSGKRPPLDPMRLPASPPPSRRTTR